ncbi:RluA family pseudouridine synthase [Ferrovum sp.]|uniref:RluA family pseudouridine synthase n=1 Tax=Ferrovum sp. TaxID=2609467 RepID=UPI00263966E7|nr:RluA family pseudouridine synthase [Ferrovum sp.]
MKILTMQSSHYNSPEENEPLELTVPVECGGLRLDQVLARLFPDWSRSRWQVQIEAGRVRLNQGLAQQKTRVCGGESLWLETEPEVFSEEVVPEDLPVETVALEESFRVIHKPAGLVVHPGHGNRHGTLQNALLFHDPAVAQVPRSGIVHRLDKDTSGLMVVARTLAAHGELVRQLQARTVHRHYWALVQGQVPAGGRIEVPVGRHATQRTRMAVTTAGRPAVTHYEVVRRLPCHTLLECRLETGRTHQIRVHMQHLGFPLAGDPVYKGKSLALDERSSAALREFRRQALHAFHLGFLHPDTRQPCAWEIPMAADMARLIQVLEEATYA